MIRSLAAVLVASLPLALAHAADSEAGIPQLESASVGWSKVADDFQLPASGPGPVTYAKDHPYVPNNDEGRQVTFRIADLTNPILKPWAIEKMREQNALAAAGKRAFEARASCRPGGVPGFLVMGRVNPLFFVQAKREVLLINEGGPEVRHVFLNVAHSAHPRISPYGESVGHYEGGDTLVVDTIGLQAKNSYLDWFRTPHTEKLHVVERFKLSADGKTLDAVVKVEDPDTFNAPLYMARSWRKVPNPLFEMVCAENNGDHFGKNLFPVPHADVADF
jgi:hypothetical protein